MNMFDVIPYSAATIVVAIALIHDYLRRRR